AAGDGEPAGLPRARGRPHGAPDRRGLAPRRQLDQLAAAGPAPARSPADFHGLPPLPAGTDTYESRFVTARDGLRLHVRDYAPEAPARSLPVVCLPGLARTAADFHALALDLVADEKRPRRVLAVDYRGRGASERDRDWRNYDVRVELDDLMQALAAL